MASNGTRETAADEYAALQTEVLEWYGVDATDHYVDLDRPAVRAHVVEAGAGDPVVFVHSGGDVALIWAPLLARMQDDFALYAPDRPGCGLSDGFSYDDVDVRQHATDFVCSLLDSRGIDRANVVAASIGGYFAFAAALDRPERFRKLVFAGYPLGIEGTRPVWRSSPVVRNLILAGSVPGFGTLFKLLLSRMDADAAREFYADQFNVDVSTYPDRYFVAYATAVQLPGAAESFVSFAKRCFRLRGLTPDADISGELSGLDVPSLFLWGEHDIAPPSVGRDAVAAIPEATFEVVEGAGHYPFADVPDWTADRISAFFRDAPRDQFDIRNGG